jgi:hypothetical protein
VSSHAYVQARFVGDLATRRKQYPASLRDVLSRLAAVREVADYEAIPISQTQASRALARAREFLIAGQLAAGSGGADSEGGAMSLASNSTLTERQPT